MQKIKTNNQYKKALRKIEKLMDKSSKLCKIIEAYEDTHYPIGKDNDNK